MKKLFFYAMLALGMTAACQKPDVEVENPDLDDNSPVEVVFGVKAPSITVTKTKAAVDDWNSETVYVYGFDSTNDFLINGVAANVGKVTDTNGAEADKSTLTFANDKKFYYQVDAVYDFYAYYTGKQGPETVSADLKAEVEIDGSQDVMLAKTNKEEDAKAVIEGKTLNEERIYSAYAARRGVHPTLVFDHMLSRFEFKVVKGQTPSTADHTAAVNVTGIEIESYNKGTLDIKAHTFTATGEKTALKSVITGTNAAYTPTEDADDSKGVISDLMVFPGESTMTLKVSLAPAKADDPNLKDIVIDPMEVTLDAAKIAGTSGAKFEAGKKYTVTITVYSLEEVQVSASLTEWVEGGSTLYDPDEEWDAAANS